MPNPRNTHLGVALRSATEHYETATAQGRLLFQMLGSFAEFERSTIRERTQDGLHRKYREGRYMGIVPYGYFLDRGAGRLQIVPEEAEIIREIFERIAAGGTLYAMAMWLNELGVPTPSRRYASKKRPPAKQWIPATIRLFVRNTRYTGRHKITLSTGELVEQTVPAIVEPALQRPALEHLEENRRYSGGRKHRDYLLSGLVTCETCGCSCAGQRAAQHGREPAPPDALLRRRHNPNPR
ncbi:MAG: recombinase family protein [Actinobacteria bacterium]|nr:recombinase family protein [Actinomycetota bacterium]